MIRTPEDYVVLDQLGEAYIAASTMIRLEHHRNGSCADREGDPLHDFLHDTLREISHTIMLYTDSVMDVPAIRAYIEEGSA